VIYPALPELFRGGVGQRILAVYAQGFKPQDDGFIHANILDEATFSRVKNDFASAFDAQVKAQPNGEWVLSSEHLHSRLIEPEQVETLAQFLLSYFTDISVYIHLRPQVDMARSLASTLARAGAKVGCAFFEKIEETSAYYNYQSLVARWAAAFGAEKIVVIPYKRQPDIQRFFLERLKLGAGIFRPVARLNESLDWRMMALLSVIRPYRENLFGSKWLPEAFKGFPCLEQLQIGLDLAQKLDRRMQTSNAALIAARPELEPGDLSPDWAAYDHPENLSQIDLPVVFAEPLVAVLSQMQLQLKQETCLTLLAESERALARRNHQTARQKLARARAILVELKTAGGKPKELKAMQNRTQRLHKMLETEP